MMKKATVYRVCLWVLTVFWGGVIWYLSLQSAPQSAALSSGLTKKILELFEAYTSLPEAEQLSVLAQVQSLVRELAHIAEYGILGLLTALLVQSYRPVRFGFLSLASVAVFSVVDECLQQFVSVGRAFQVIDLLKDWFGAFLGIAFVWLVYHKGAEPHNGFIRCFSPYDSIPKKSFVIRTENTTDNTASHL